MTPLWTRAEFSELEAKAATRSHKDGRLLAFVAVGLGLGQLALIRYLDASVAPGTAKIIEASVFAGYALLVFLLLRRLLAGQRTMTVRCPACGNPLTGQSARLAVATGNCDQCGGQVLQPNEESTMSGDA